MIEINKNPSVRELRQFGVIWIVFFGLISSVTWYQTGSLDLALKIFAAALVVATIGFLAPPFMRLVFVGMSYLAFPIGWTISHLALGLVYYLVLAPIGLIMKLTGHNPLERTPDRDAESYWKAMGEQPKGQSYFRQF